MQVHLSLEESQSVCVRWLGPGCMVYVGAIRGGHRNTFSKKVLMEAAQFFKLKKLHLHPEIRSVKTQLSRLFPCSALRISWAPEDSQASWTPVPLLMATYWMEGDLSFWLSAPPGLHPASIGLA